MGWRDTIQPAPAPSAATGGWRDTIKPAGSPDAPTASAGGGGGTPIAAAEQYAPDEGALQRASGAIGYLGNISKSAILGADRGGMGQAWEYAKQAARKERMTNATLLKDTLFGKHRFGKDDNHFDAGDIGDFAGDLLVDVVTDPLTWVSGGISSLAKGGKMAKFALGAANAEKVAKAAGGFKIGEATAAAAKYGAFKRGTSAAIGATYGLGSSDIDGSDGYRDEAARVLGGAVAGYLMPSALKVGGEGFRKGANAISDWYATETRGSKFAGFTAARSVAAEAMEKKANIAAAIVQGKTEILAGLNPVDRIRTAEVLHDLFNTTVQYRNKFPNLGDAHVINEVQKEVLPQVLAQENKAVANAVTDWAKANTSVMSDLERATGNKAAGIPWHIPNMYEKQSFQQVEKGIRGMGLLRAKKGVTSPSAEKMANAMFAEKFGRPFNAATKNAAEIEAMNAIKGQALDKTYAAYADKFASNFLKPEEKKALNFMREYSETAALQSPVRAMETVLRGYDRMNNFGKAMMLYPSLSWMKNNYFDNLGKAYMENGLHGLVDAQTFGAFHTGLAGDVKDLLLNKLSKRVYSSPDMKEMMAKGVLDAPLSAATEDKFTRAFLKTPEQIAAAEKALPLHERVLNAIQNNPLNRVTKFIGGHMEGTARATTYIRTRDALLASPRFANAGAKEIELAKDIAAKITKDTFFDYGDITHLERAVAGRLVPFYSFFSKNVPYWMKASVDPERAGRLNNFLKVYGNIGSAPTARDREGMSPYIANAMPRVLGKENGNKIYGIVPSMSVADAIQGLTSTPGEHLAKMASPLLKTPYELFTGKDLFADGKLYPSDITDANKAKMIAKDQDTYKKGEKFLYSRGHKYLMAKSALEKLGVDTSNIPLISGVKLDHNGNPVTTRDQDVFFDKILSTLLPLGILDQVTGSVGKVQTGKETPTEAVMNQVLPMKEVKVSPAAEGWNRSNKAKQRAKEKYGQ